MRKHPHKKSKTHADMVSIAMGFALAAVFFIVGGLHFLPRGTDRNVKGIVPATPGTPAYRDLGMPQPRRVRIIIRNVPSLDFPVERPASHIPTASSATQEPAKPLQPQVLPTTLLGTIMNVENELPVSGAAVKARAGTADFETFSDATGNFRLVGIPGDAGTASVTITAPGYAPLVVDVPISQSRGGLVETHVALVPVGSLCGRVLDTDGKPVHFAEVSVAPENATAHDTWLASSKTTTAADGSCSFSNLRRVHTYILSVSSTGYSDWNRGGILVEAYPAETRVEVRLLRKGVLYGKVVNSSGTGIGGVRVIATHSQTKTTALAISEPDGKYRVENLSAGMYQVSANVPRMLPFQSAVKVEGSTVLLIQMKKRGIISGKCVAADGGSLPPRTTVQVGKTGPAAALGETDQVPDRLFTRTYYTAKITHGDPAGAVQMENAAAGGATAPQPEMDPVVSGWDGQIYFDDLDEGTYCLIIDGDGFLLGEFKGIEVLFGRPAENLVFTLKRGATLLGSVINGESGQPLKHVLVSVYEVIASEAQPYGRKIAEVATRGDGQFLVDGLAPGSFLVLAAHYAFLANSSPASVRDGDRIVQLQICMKPAGCLTGAIVGPDGTPRAFTCLLVTTLDGRTSFIVTADRDGKFVLGPLKPATYRITDTGQLIEVSAGKSTELRIQSK